MKMTNNIKELRLKMGLSHRQLANKLGVHKSCINHWENNKTSITKQHKQQLCEIFDCNEIQLLFKKT